MMADSLPSAHRFATPLPHAEASASNNLEPKQLFLSETFAFSLPHAGASASNNLEPKHLFLGEAFAFSLTLLRGVFLAGQSFPPRRRTAVTKRWRGPMRQELCLSSCRSSFLPSSLQRWAEAASFLLGVCGHYSRLQLFPLCSAPTAPSQHGQCLR